MKPTKTCFFYLIGISIIVDVLCAVGYIFFAYETFMTEHTQQGTGAMPYHVLSLVLTILLVFLFALMVRIAKRIGPKSWKLLWSYLTFSLLLLIGQVICLALLMSSSAGLTPLSEPLVEFCSNAHWGYFFSMGMLFIVLKARADAPIEELERLI